MNRKQGYVYFYDSYCVKTHQKYDSDIFQLKIKIPDKHNLFETLGGGSSSSVGADYPDLRPAWKLEFVRYCPVDVPKYLC